MMTQNQEIDYLSLDFANEFTKMLEKSAQPSVQQNHSQIDGRNTRSSFSPLSVASSNGKAIIRHGQIISYSDQQLMRKQEMRLINTDISQLPPMIKEVDENTRRGRRKKKLQVYSATLQRKMNKRKLGNRMSMTAFNPGLEDVDESSGVMNAEGMSEQELSEMISPMALKHANTQYRNPSIASVNLEEADQLGGTYSSNKNRPNLQNLLGSGLPQNSKRMQTFIEKPISKLPKRSVMSKGLSFDDVSNQLSFNKPVDAASPLPKRQITRMPSGMESIIESRENFGPPSGSKLHLNLQRATKPESPTISTPVNESQQPILQQIDLTLEMQTALRVRELKEVVGRKSLITKNTYVNDRDSVASQASQGETDHRIQQSISLFTEHAGDPSKISRKSKFAQAQSTKNANASSSKLFGPGFMPTSQSQARLTVARESRIKHGFETNQAKHRLQSQVFDFNDTLRRPSSASTFLQTQLHRTAFQHQQMLQQRAIMAREEQMKKEALNDQMAKLNPDLYSYDQPGEGPQIKKSEVAQSGFYKSGISGRKLLASIVKAPKDQESENVSQIGSGVGQDLNSDSLSGRDNGSNSSVTKTEASRKTLKDGDLTSTKKGKKLKKSTKTLKKAKEEEVVKPLTAEEIEQQKIMAVYEARRERAISNLYPEPTTKIFLNQVKSKLIKSGSKKKIPLPNFVLNDPKILPSKLQLMSRQTAFLAQNKKVLNRDLTDLSADIASGSSKSAQNLTEEQQPDKRVKRSQKSLKILPSLYEDPVFETHKLKTQASLNIDLQTISKPTVKKRPPVVVKKYGINVNKKKAKDYASKNALFQIKERKEQKRQYGDLAIDGVQGFKSKTKIARKCKSIVTVKNFGGKGTTTVFMRTQTNNSEDRSLVEAIRIQKMQQLWDVEDILKKLESLTDDENESKQLSKAEQDVWQVKRAIKIGWKRDGASPATILFHENKKKCSFYNIGRVLGKGAYGKVNLAIQKLSNKLLAVKSVNKKYIEKRGIEAYKKLKLEICLLEDVRHPNIVKLYETLTPEESGTDYFLMFMELCAGGDLLHFVRKRRKVEEPIVKLFMKQIISGIGYLHHKNIVHRDIKLENILLNNLGQIKICDLGVSQIVSDDENAKKLNDCCGTPAYMAPEVVKVGEQRKKIMRQKDKNPEQIKKQINNLKEYKQNCDIWSAGVVMYALLFGQLPYKGVSTREIKQKIEDVKYEPLYFDCSSEAIDLMQRMMTKNPDTRIGIEEILEHPWFQDTPSQDQVTIFTKAERVLMIKEFFVAEDEIKWGRQNIWIDGIERDELHEQGIDLLQSTPSDAPSNHSTKSIILAPNNSTQSNPELLEDDKFKANILRENEKVEQQKYEVIGWNKNTRRADLKYEREHNANVDNGVINKDANEIEIAEMVGYCEMSEEMLDRLEQAKDLVKKITTPEKQLEPKEPKKQKRSDIKLNLRNPQIDSRLDIEEHNRKETNPYAPKLEIRGDIVYQVNGFGYPKNEILRNLLENKNNHCTTTYYLLEKDHEIIR